LIVRSAEDPEIAGVARATQGSWIDVVELEESASVAAATAFRDVRTAKPIALEDRATRGPVDASTPSPTRIHSAHFDLSWALQFCEPLSLEISEQEIDGELDHDREVAARVRVAHEVSAQLELLTKRFARREFDFEPIPRKRLDARFPTDGRRSTSAWKARGEEHLDLALALPRDGRQKLAVIFLRQQFAQEGEIRKVQAAGREEREHHGKAASEAGSEDASKCFAFAESEHFGAELEHRGETGQEVETPLLDLGEVRHDLGGERAVRARELRRG
jgi:hypothetical protein